MNILIWLPEDQLNGSREVVKAGLINQRVREIGREEVYGSGSELFLKVLDFNVELKG